MRVGNKAPTRINSKTLVSANTPKCPTDASNSGKRRMADLARRSSWEAVVSEKKPSYARSHRLPRSTPASRRRKPACVALSGRKSLDSVRRPQLPRPEPRAAQQTSDSRSRSGSQASGASTRGMRKSDAALLTKITGVGGHFGRIEPV